MVIPKAKNEEKEGEGKRSPIMKMVEAFHYHDLIVNGPVE